MGLSRRDFSKMFGLGLAGMATRSVHSDESGLYSRNRLPIMQGSTDISSTVISVLGSRSVPLEFKVVEMNSNRLLSSVHVSKIEKPFSESVQYRLSVEQLDLGQTYQLLVLSEKDHRILDERVFSALDLEKERLKWVFGSCMEEGLHTKAIWDSMKKLRPDFIILLGDVVYIDIKWGGSKEVSEERLWGRHVVARKVIDLYFWEELVPTFAVWDDHDFGLNNSDRRFPLKFESQIIFDSFFPCQESKHVSLGPGLAKMVSTPSQDFFLLDCRSFRSEPKAKREVYFGEDQLKWLEERVDPSKITWLMMGSQWTVPYEDTENFSITHPQAYRETFQRLRDSKGQFVLCSGDIHWSEVTGIPDGLLPYKTLELTSSRIHSYGFTGSPIMYRNPLRMESTGSKNFCYLETELVHKSIHGFVRSYTANSRIKYEVDLSQEVSF